MSSERDNLMAALCLAPVQRNEKGRQLRERGWETACWQTSSERQQIILGEVKSSPRIFNVMLKANFVLFWVCFTQTACWWQGVLKRRSWQPSHTQSINQSMKESINRSVYATKAQMNRNKQQTMLLLWSNTTVPWSSSDKLKSLSVGWDALFLCTFVLTLMTYFINHVFFYWTVRETERQRARHFKKKNKNGH